MTLLQFTLKNLTRRRTRTALTVMGIGVGIGAVVALLGLAWGLQESWDEAMRARHTDLVVRNASGGIMAQPFDEALEKKVSETPGVAATAGILVEALSIEEVPMMVVSGREWKSFLWESFDLLEGRLPVSGEERVVVLGRLAAETLKKKPGDTLTIEVEEFKVAGIVDGKAVVENGAVMISLSVLQDLMQRKGLVSFINVRLKPGVKDQGAVAREISSRTPGCKVENASELAAKNDGFQIFQAMNYGTSAIALLVGTFGVMNTMFMSVFERTREIGILIALGWRRTRILLMILWESVALCIAAGVLGIVFGVVLLKVLAVTPWMSGRLEPHIGPDLMGLALGIAIVVGIASGLYPALQCTRINPSEAIR
ncbi:MAG: ABC transporter permease [Verrucomicrobiaceae bacterium]|nr:ABC transporter permease [Verrucomicrobiaceae bacterium]